MPVDVEAQQWPVPATAHHARGALAAANRDGQASSPARAAAGASEMRRALSAVAGPLAAAASGMLGGMALGAVTAGTQGLLRGMPAPAAWGASGARVGGFIGLGAGTAWGSARTLRAWGPAAARPAECVQGAIERAAVGLLMGLAGELTGAGVGGIVAGAGAQGWVIASWSFLGVALGPSPAAAAVWGARLGAGAGVTAVGLLALWDRRVAAAPPRAVCQELLAALAAYTVDSDAAWAAGSAAGGLLAQAVQMAMFAALMATAAGVPAILVGSVAAGEAPLGSAYPTYARIAAHAGAWTGALATPYLLDEEALFEAFAISVTAPGEYGEFDFMRPALLGTGVVFANAIVGPLAGAAVGGIAAAASWLCQVGDPGASVRIGMHVGMAAPVLLALAVVGARLRCHLARARWRAARQLSGTAPFATAV